MKRKKLNLKDLQVTSFITASERSLLRAGLLKETEVEEGGGNWSEPGPCECTCECSGCLRN